MEKIKRLYYKLFKHYQRLDLKFVSYSEAEKMLQACKDKPPHEQWELASEEDRNPCIGYVYLERRRRIL